MLLLYIHIDLITCKYTCIYIYTHICIYIYITLTLWLYVYKPHIYIYISVRYRTKQLASWQLQLDDLIPPTDFSFYKSTSVLLNLRLDADNLSNLQLANLKLPINSAFYQQNQVNSLAFRAAWIVTLSVRLISRTTLSNRQWKKNGIELVAQGQRKPAAKRLAYVGIKPHQNPHLSASGSQPGVMQRIASWGCGGWIVRLLHEPQEVIIFICKRSIVITDALPWFFQFTVQLGSRLVLWKANFHASAYQTEQVERYNSWSVGSWGPGRVDQKNQRDLVSSTPSVHVWALWRALQGEKHLSLQQKYQRKSIQGRTLEDCFKHSAWESSIVY